jgi:hypothetical protein
VMPTDFSDTARYAGYRFTIAIIHHALWLVLASYLAGKVS